VEAGSSSIFGGNLGLYQSILILLVTLMMVNLVINYFLLCLVIYYATQKAHSNMLEAILRSPACFFDVTPSSILTSKFSNDFNLLDYVLIYSLNSSIQAPIAILIAVTNMVQINFHFIVPAIIFFIVAFIFFQYAKPAIVKCKELDLQNKNPLYGFFQ
jgi:hypothetical protein